MTYYEIYFNNNKHRGCGQRQCDKADIPGDIPGAGTVPGDLWVWTAVLCPGGAYPQGEALYFPLPAAEALRRQHTGHSHRPPEERGSLSP